MAKVVLNPALQVLSGDVAGFVYRQQSDGSVVVAKRTLPDPSREFSVAQEEQMQKFKEASARYRRLLEDAGTKASYEQLVALRGSTGRLRALVMGDILKAPVISTLDELDRSTLIHVLTHPRNAITKQFRKLFRMHSHEIEFTPEGLIEIADQAVRRATGARGLRGIVEKFMLDAQFELPGIKEPRRYLVTAEVVSGKKNLLESYAKVQKLPQAQVPPEAAA